MVIQLLVHHVQKDIIKIRQDKYVVYNFEWLMKNLDMEFAHLQRVKELNIDPKNCKIILESMKEKQ